MSKKIILIQLKGRTLVGRAGEVFDNPFIEDCVDIKEFLNPQGGLGIVCMKLGLLHYTKKDIDFQVDLASDSPFYQEFSRVSSGISIPQKGGIIHGH